MPSETSVARTGIYGYCSFRIAVRMPVPQPLSKALVLGLDRGSRSDTRFKMDWQGGVVRRSTWA